MGGKTGTSTSTTTIPPQVLARYNSVNSQAQGVAATPFQQYSTNPNAFVAPVNQQQYAGIGGINQAANMAQPAFGAAEAGTFNATQQATPQGFQSGVSNYMNPFLNTAVQGTVNQLQNVNQQQQQSMLGNAISQGAFGGDRANIGLGNLMNQQNLALGQTVAGMENQGFQNAAQNYQTGINQQLAGSNQLGNLGAGAQQSALAGAQAQLGAGTMEQQTQQAGNTALYNQFQQQQAYPFQVAQFLANIAEGTGALSGSTTTSTQPMPFFSDRRLKENIKKVGKANNGLPIYTYNYKNDPTEQTHIGFMADEVEKKHPDAVGLAGGYKTVDYEKAARPAKFSGGALSSEGGLVVPQHAGMGFAAGGTPAEAPAMPAGLAHLIAMQNEMPVRGGGINQDVAASAQAIAPQNFVPPEAMSAPINYFSQITDPAASPAAAPDLSTDTTGLMPNHNNQMFNLSNDPTASYSGYGGQNSPSEYGPGPGMGLAAGGRIGKEGGGSVYDMIAQQQAIYDQLVKGIPTSRNIATGAPSQQHQLLGANQPKPQQPQSGLQQLGGVSGLIGLGKEASQGYDWAKAHMPSSSTPAATSAPAAAVDSSIAAAAPAAPQDAEIKPALDAGATTTDTSYLYARGGVAGRYADGGTAQDDMPYKDPNDLDIPNENNNYKLNQEANPQGSSSGTSQTGLGIGQALQLANMAGSAMSGIGSALGLLALKSGGVAGRGHYADGGDPRPDAADINGPIDPDLSNSEPIANVGRLAGREISKAVESPDKTPVDNVISDPMTGYAPELTIKNGSNDIFAPVKDLNNAIATGAQKTYGAFQRFENPYNNKEEPPTSENQYGYGSNGPVVPTGIAPKKPIEGMSDADLAWAAQHNKASAVETNPVTVPVTKDPAAAPNVVPTNNVKATGTPAPDTSQGLGSAKNWFDDAGNRNMALSILSGLGHMAGSNSRYLGSAILQGLGGGAETYGTLQGQTADIALKQAETAQISQKTAQQDFFTPPGQEPKVLMPNNQTWTLKQWRDAGQPPTRSQSATGLTGATNNAGQVPVRPVSQPQVTTFDPVVNGVGDSGVSSAKADAQNWYNTDPDVKNGIIKQNQNIENNIASNAQAAADQNRQLMLFAKDLASQPDNNFLTGGPLNNTVLTAAKYYNNIAYGLGLPKVDEKDVDNAAVINKMSSGINLSTANASEMHNMMALREAVLNTPGTVMSKSAALQAVSGMIVKNQPALDQNGYLQDYKKLASSESGMSGTYNANNALTSFRADHTNDQYAKEQKLLNAFFTAKDPTTGRTHFEMYQNGEITPQQIDKWYGRKGLHRIIQTQ